MSECKSSRMCKLGIYTKEDAKKWLLLNHPDKNSNDFDSSKFTDVTNCFKERKFCPPGAKTVKIRQRVLPKIKGKKKRLTQKAHYTSSPRSAPRSPPRSASTSAPASVKNIKRKIKIKSSKKFNRVSPARKKIYNCMRQTENWSKILPQHKFDSPKFEPETVADAIENASPKLEQLFKIIEQVDENDMQTHGKLFKHFIFSDVKEQGYGAKILASAFVGMGYKNLITAKKVGDRKAMQLSLLKAGADGLNKSFGVLSSTAIFKSEFNQKFKKEVLNTYNKRPDNIQGEDMRFIILDSGFKEGIDLFDVKYVHIFESSMTVADLKQTIGRATRTCGQKGLNFEPNVGWPLYVYNYFIVVPEEFKDVYKASNLTLLENSEDEYIFKDAEKFKDSTILYSGFDKTLVNLSSQLYKLAPVFSIDFELTKNIHSIDDVTYLYDTSAPTDEEMTGGVRDINAINKKNKINCTGRCGLRSTKDIFATVTFMRYVYDKYKHDKHRLPNKKVREFLCNYMKENPGFCKQMNTEWANRAAILPTLLHKRITSKSVPSTSTKATKAKTKVNAKTNEIAISERRDSTTPDIDEDIEDIEDIEESGSVPRSVSSIRVANDIMQELDIVPYIKPIDNQEYAIVKYKPHVDVKLKQKIPQCPPKKLNFTQMRDFIRTNYSNGFTWDEIKIENKCIDKKAEGGGEKACGMKLDGGAPRIMSLNPTQDFVRTFFTPKSPYKGMLLWHSVGTGKTCSAIATATSSFENDDYTILWVTRNTLKSDVYKNMFDDVCHIILADKIKKGLIMPNDVNARKRLLSNNWIEPISYKTFSNLLTPGGHNVYLDKLTKKNGTTDVIKKTLIIIDEAHKLYGGDLKGSERPDMKIMERLLQNSYDKSGKDSARLLIMTATPFTDSPMEFFKLINLCKEVASEKITINPEEFKNTYMDEDNILSNAGVKKLADKLSGYVSYLNREQDPTQFAQPVMIDVPTIMSQIPVASERNDVAKYIIDTNNKAGKDMREKEKENNKTVKTFKKDQKLLYTNNVKELKARISATQKNIKASLKDRQLRCKTIKNKEEKKKCMDDAKDEMETELETEVNKIKEQIELLKNEYEKEGNELKNKPKLKELKERVGELKEDLIQEIMFLDRCKSVKV